MPTNVPTGDTVKKSKEGDKAVKKSNCSTNDLTDEEKLLRQATIVPPDGGWGWVVVTSVFLNLLLTEGTELSAGQALLPLLKEHYGTTTAETSLIFSLQSAFFYFTGPFSGAFINVFGCRRVALAGSIICFFGMFISTFATSVAFLYISYGVLAGIGMGTVFLSGMTITSQYFEKKRALATGLAMCGSGVGTFVLPPLVTYLAEQYHWRQVMLILSGIQMHNFIFAALYRSVKPTREQVISVGKTIDNILLHKKMSDRRLSRVENELSSIMEDQSEGILEQLSKEAEKETNAFQAISSVGDERSLKRALSVRPKFVKSFYNRQLSVNVNWELQRCRDKDKKFQMLYSSIRSFNKPMERYDTFYTGRRQSLDSCDKQSIVEKLQHAEEPKSVLLMEKEKGTMTMMKDVLKQLIDWRLLKNPTYIIFSLSNILTSAGFFVPFLYLPAYAETYGVQPEPAAFLLSILGVTNTVSRIASGWIADLPQVDSMILITIANFIAGFFTILLPCFQSYELLMAYSVMYGVGIGSLSAQRSIVLLKLVGLEYLTTGIGLCMLFMGFSSLAGQPIAGLLYQLNGNYTASFSLAGSFMVIASILYMIVRVLYKKLSSKRVREDSLESADKTSVSCLPSLKSGMTNVKKGIEKCATKLKTR